MRHYVNDTELNNVSAFMQSVVVLNVVVLSVVMLNVDVLNVVILNIVILTGARSLSLNRAPERYFTRVGSGLSRKH